jgi:hypothetical protein
VLHCLPYNRKLVRKDAIGCCASTSALAAGSLHLTRIRRPSVAARSRSYQEMQDLLSLGPAIDHCTCASADAERTADTERLGSGRGCCHAFYFLECQPTSCVSDLAEVLPVSHFDCLIPAFCSFRIKSTGPRSRACAALTSIMSLATNPSISADLSRIIVFSYQDRSQLRYQV